MTQLRLHSRAVNGTRLQIPSARETAEESRRQPENTVHGWTMALRLLRSLGRCRVRSLGRLFLAVFLAAIAIELLLLNFVVFYAYYAVKRELEPLRSKGPGTTFLDALFEHPRIKDLLYAGKEGGFVQLLQDTVERLHVVSYPSRRGRGESRVSFLGLDVSHSGEASYLLRRLGGRGVPSPPSYPRLLVDVGASDGLLSSNSFNFLQWGWSAILVEPQAAETARIQRNVARYIDPYREGNQTITIVQAVMGRKNGVVQFAITDRSLGMESHVVQEDEEVDENAILIQVPSITVRSFAQRYRVPKRFGILSIDAEGMGHEVLHMWIDEGFRPGYIIYENLHNSEPLPETTQYLIKNGYKYLTTRGWNHIFEHRVSDIRQ